MRTRERYPVPALREFRALARMTQGELAATTGKSVSFISHLETGRAGATENVLIELSVALRVEPTDLIRRPVD